MVQDDVSSPGHPFALGLTLEKVAAHTVDEEGNTAFVTHNPLELLRKACSMPGCTQLFFLFLCVFSL